MNVICYIDVFLLYHYTIIPEQFYSWGFDSPNKIWPHLFVASVKCPNFTHNYFTGTHYETIDFDWLIEIYLFHHTQFRKPFFIYKDKCNCKSPIPFSRKRFKSFNKFINKLLLLFSHRDFGLSNLFVLLCNLLLFR